MLPNGDETLTKKQILDTVNTYIICDSDKVDIHGIGCMSGINMSIEYGWVGGKELRVTKIFCKMQKKTS